MEGGSKPEEMRACLPLTTKGKVIGEWYRRIKVFTIQVELLTPSPDSMLSGFDQLFLGVRARNFPYPV